MSQLKYNFYAGQKFYSWTVIEEKLPKSNPRQITCKCVCGTIATHRPYSLMKGKTKSCCCCANRRRVI